MVPAQSPGRQVSVTIGMFLHPRWPLSHMVQALLAARDGCFVGQETHNAATDPTTPLRFLPRRPGSSSGDHVLAEHLLV